jgi:hypothetical protein
MSVCLVREAGAQGLAVAMFGGLGSISMPSARIKEFIKSSAMLRRLYYRAKIIQGARGQSDEDTIISALAKSTDAPKTFTEFGFHPIEFNCASLAQNPDWQGLLIDGNGRQASDARSVLPRRIEIVEAFLTLDNLDFIKSKFKRLGVLSIDVDGNDYWFLERLIGIKPSIICIEYNASFGPESITVPYDDNFDRHQKHPSGWYHGASLAAIAKLCAAHGYGLAAVSEAGGNAFFTLIGDHLDPATAWKPSRFRREYSGVTQADQWQRIRHMPFIQI